MKKHQEKIKKEKKQHLKSRVAFLLIIFDEMENYGKIKKNRKGGDTMLNFIICEDNHQFSAIMKTTIDNFMMNYEIDYKIHYFECYDKDFENIVKEEIGFKVYFLDLVTNQGTGLDAARIIREKYDDWVSIIIIVTSHEEYKYEALGTRLALFDFVNKLNGCEKVLRQDLNRVMSNYDKREKSLSYEYNHICHKIDFRHIISIEKEQDSKRCIIHTTYGNKTIAGSLNSVLKLLDKRFMKIHRSLIVNIDQIESYDASKNKLVFKDGTYTNLIARDKKKELMIRVRTNY